MTLGRSEEEDEQSCAAGRHPCCWLVAALVPQMMVVTRRAAEKAYERFAETDYCSKLMRLCCAGGVGLRLSGLCIPSVLQHAGTTWQT